MAKKRPMLTLSEEIRQVLAESPISRYQLAKRTGISEGQLSRFLHGQQGVTLANLDILARELGIHIAAPKGQRRKAR